jgi:hypothetical protein
MPRLIIHQIPLTRDEIEEKRLIENLALSPQERMHKMFELMQLSMMLKNGPLKSPRGLGVILKRAKS